jgi:hypothetical protein
MATYPTEVPSLLTAAAAKSRRKSRFTPMTLPACRRGPE